MFASLNWMVRWSGDLRAQWNDACWRCLCVVFCQGVVKKGEQGALEKCVGINRYATSR
ncbi:hypothetical protein SAMN03159335_06287 [Burkholderia cepacia]|nr:hypothetical protein SAMN03159335_06287 [Burkholderia cepacia]